MSTSDLPKLWTEPTKIGHIFRKQSTLKNFIYKSWSPSQIFFTEKKSESFSRFLMPKNDFENTNANFEDVVHNFGRSDAMMTWFSEKMLIFNICRHGLMPNVSKKSWTVSRVGAFSYLNNLICYFYHTQIHSII